MIISFQNFSDVDTPQLKLGISVTISTILEKCILEPISDLYTLGKSSGTSTFLLMSTGIDGRVS
jgi:hypothetical protein